MVADSLQQKVLDMKTLELLQPEKVNSLSTKFFYKKKRLCYQIMVSYDESPFLFYRNFEQYNDYRRMHDAIIAAMHDRSTIRNSFFPVNGKH